MAGPEGTAPLQLLVGLGNPGDKYVGTRHNVGFMALERLAAQAGGSFKQQSKLHGLLAEVGVGSKRLRLLMPQTFMNDSGRSIRAALDWFDLEPAQMLVVVDDMDLPLGRLRLRLSGGAGGHNGLRSAISHLGTQDFPRLRIGIGRPPGRMDAAAYVLQDFSTFESEIMNLALDRAVDAMLTFVTEGLETAMNKFNVNA